MAVNDINDILEKIENHEKRINDLEGQLKSYKQDELNAEIIDDKFPHNLCERAKINENQLAHVFYHEDGFLELVCTIEGESTAEKQFNSTIAVLTFFHFWKDVDKLKSVEIREILKKEKKLSLNNFSTNLQKDEYKKYIRPDGINGSHEFSYKITNPLGIEKGLEIIQLLALSDKSDEE